MRARIPSRVNHSDPAVDLLYLPITVGAREWRFFSLYPVCGTSWGSENTETLFYPEVQIFQIQVEVQVIVSGWFVPTFSCLMLPS